MMNTMIIGTLLAVCLATCNASCGDDCENNAKVAEFVGLRPGRFAGKVCFVTGATSGLGEHAAYHLAKEGCAVVVTGRREENGAKYVLNDRLPRFLLHLQVVLQKKTQKKNSQCQSVVHFPSLF